MAEPGMPIKMVKVDANQFESIAYTDGTRRLYIKFRTGQTVCIDGLPRFRYQGLLAAPRKDAYYNTYIKNSFLAKEVQLPPSA